MSAGSEVAAEGKDDLAWTTDTELIGKAAIRRHLNKRKKSDVKFNSQAAAAAKQPRCEERRKNGDNKYK